MGALAVALPASASSDSARKRDARSTVARTVSRPTTEPSESSVARWKPIPRASRVAKAPNAAKAITGRVVSTPATVGLIDTPSELVENRASAHDGGPKVQGADDDPQQQRLLLGPGVHVRVGDRHRPCPIAITAPHESVRPAARTCRLTAWRKVGGPGGVAAGR